MFFRSIQLFLAGLMTALLLTACGGGNAPPAPTNLRVTAGESSATLTWDTVNGVEYWVFVAPTSFAPTSGVASMQAWFGLPGGNVLLRVSSPYVVQGLVNGTDYTFTINGKVDGGPGGSGATPVTATPRIAGSSWVPGTATGSDDLRSMAYGSTVATTSSTGTYVAVGAAGAMYSSTDGTDWSAIDHRNVNSNSNRLNGASFFGTYKVVGDGGLVLTSPDAVTWTEQTGVKTLTTQNLYAIASNGLNLNVAVGAGGTIIYSPDGIIWTAASNSATSADLYAVNYSAYTNGTWVAVGAGGTIVYSNDGSDWQNVSSAAMTHELSGVANLASFTASGTGTFTITATFVAVGASGTVLSSNDAVLWAPVTVAGLSANLNAVVYGTQFVAVGADGNILYSTDGLNWAPGTTTPADSHDILAVVHGLDGFYAVGASGSNRLSK